MYLGIDKQVPFGWSNSLGGRAKPRREMLHPVARLATGPERSRAFRFFSHLQHFISTAVCSVVYPAKRLISLDDPIFYSTKGFIAMRNFRF